MEYSVNLMTTRERLTIPLGDLNLSAAIAGGKGAGLNRLIRGGFPVPPGFLISTQAYAAVVEVNHLTDAIAAGNAERLQRAFDECVIPEHIARSIQHAYRELTDNGRVPVAVRSSATAEDLIEASFAGQQDSFLNVSCEESLWTSIRRCWASLWNDRAQAYRAQHGIDTSNISIAVVIQQMVAADAAGVLFTINPVSHEEREVVINATWGLGDALVSGRVSPDSFVLDKQSNELSSQVIGNKALMSVPAADGVVEVAVDESKRNQPSLTPALAAELATLGREIEAMLGRPQDIEWAVSSGRPVILQARPVTVSRLPDREIPPGDDNWPITDERPVQEFDLWTHADMAERWPEPVTPLTWSLADLTTNSNFAYALRDMGGQQRNDIQWARRLFGRVYMNEGALAELLFHAGMPTSVADAALGSGLPSSLRLDAPLQPRRLIRSLPRMVRTSLQRTRSERKYRAFFVDAERWLDEYTRRDLDTPDDGELWHEIAGVWMVRFNRGIDLHADATSQAMSTLWILGGLVKRWGGGENMARDLVSGLEDVRSAEMAPALWTIATELHRAGLAGIVLGNEPTSALSYLRTEPAAVPAMRLLGQFLRQHGHRATIEGELRYPRWVEAPEQVLGLLKGYLLDPGMADPRVTEAANRRRLEAQAAAFTKRLGRVRGPILHLLVRRGRQLVSLRDNGQDYMVRLLLPIRALCARLGTRWAARGWLASADDVFFLHWHEMEDLSVGGDSARHTDLQAGVAARKAAYEYWFTVAAPDVVGHDGLPIAVNVVDPDSAIHLKGIPASSGRARGIARIARSPQEAAQLRRGEILVARSTDPGWTPAFALAGGLVLEVGGQLSHGAIVAREYGLPAVMNVPDVLVRIRSGQMITVDGSLGTVYVDGQEDA
jgi:pyruvate,water dikinase